MSTVLDATTATNAALVLSTAAGAYAVMHAMHGIGDHWIQTDKCAQAKSAPGTSGRLACAWHVLTYIATMTGAVVAAAAGVALAVGLGPAGTWILLSPMHLVIAMTLTAVTHYIADRRTPLRRLAAATGHRRFVELGLPREGRDDLPTLGTGMYALDQSAHIGLLLPAAVIIAAGAPV